MKIYFKKSYYKNYLQNRQRKELRNRRRFKKYRIALHIKNNLTEVERHDRLIIDKYSRFKKVSAPEILSIIINPEGVIKFIGKLREYFLSKTKVFVQLLHVSKIEYNAIVVLLSIMIRFKSQKIEFNGDLPYDENARNILQQSKFFPNLNKYIQDSDRYKIGDLNNIHTHAWKNVDAKLGEKIIEKASLSIWPTARRCQGVQRILLELMQNTNNHATIGKTADRHWWLSVNHIPQEKRVCFSFIDFGVGIFKSLENKPIESKFWNWAEKMYQKYKYGNNAELLKLILDGELHKTVTGEYFRGKGLPGVKDALNRNQISALYIITNNVFGDVTNEKYRLLNQNFEGTFVYWELNEKNINCNGAT